MEYMGDMKYWDDKFALRGNKLLCPEKSLVENLTYLKKGTVLDIACGDGRNTLFLLENQFRVTGIDFSSEALKRLEFFAKQNNYSVITKQANLTDENSLKDMGAFDNIIINHYRLNKKQTLSLRNNISDNGILFICGFGPKHKTDNKIRREDLIEPTDFSDINECFELLKYNENEDEIGSFVTYIFRKKGKTL